MAKVPFSKLQASINGCDATVVYANRAGENVKYEVKYYLPIKEKMELVSRIINQSIDDNGFYNPMRVKLYTVLEVVYAYTNLSFTEKMKEDPFKLYDILISTGIFSDIVAAICDNDWKEIQENIWITIDNIYKYKDSIVGILDTIKEDYGNLNFDLKELQDNISNPDNLSLLKQILDLSGLKS